jgi:quercetin dioxygenase-like cupin family protein
VSDAIVNIADGETISDRTQRNVVILAQRPEICITWSRYSTGERGPDLHVHREHTDAFYVLDGELTFTLGAEEERMGVAAGGFVAVPPNLAHAFVNEGDADARWLNFHAPDTGFAAYMRGLRDGKKVAFDSFDPPAGGGLPAAAAIVAGPGEGERLKSGNRVSLVKGVLPALSLFDWTVDGPRDGPDLHHHDEQCDSFYVLEGEIDVTVEESVYAVGPDTLASVPHGVKHTFAHSRAGTARVLNLHAPDGGFADFMRRTSE